MLLRAARVNEVAWLIYTLDADFSENKKGQKSDFSLLSCEVTPTGHRSNLLLVDIERLSKIIVA
jgi:hypothetical protein